MPRAPLCHVHLQSMVQAAFSLAGSRALCTRAREGMNNGYTCPASNARRCVARIDGTKRGAARREQEGKYEYARDGGGGRGIVVAVKGKTTTTAATITAPVAEFGESRAGECLYEYSDASRAHPRAGLSREAGRQGWKTRRDTRCVGCMGNIVRASRSTDELSIS